MRNLINFIYQFRFIIVALAVVVSMYLYRTATRSYRYSQKKVMMGTSVVIDVCSDNKHKEQLDSAYEDVWVRLEGINERMNVYNDKSDVSRVNNAPVNKDVIIAADTFYVIKKALEYWETTERTFDISIWPLLKFWRERAASGVEPTEAEVAEVKAKIGLHNIVLTERGTVKRLNPNLQIDLGGIAKGYAIDEAARILEENGFEHIYVNAGGDIYTGGEGCNGKPWHIGIQNPKRADDLIEVVALVDSAVTTSGNYEQHYRLKNKELSHIIDPRSGYPQSGVVSSTVIAPSALEADVLSTALTILEVEEGIKLIESLGENYATLIFTDEEENGILKRFESRSLSKFLDVKESK